MDKRKDYIGTALYVLLGIVLALTITQGLALALSTDLPIVAVESNSMVPTFQKGDILVLQGVAAEELKIGDIIVFSPAGQAIPVVHRIIAKNGDGSFQTQGDANPTQLAFERLIKPEQIHGRVVLIAPYLGWVKIGILEYALPNAGIMLAVAIVLALLYLAMQKYRK
ncbi:MAG: signal peptidase I [Candidatus Aenigmarchaeota archaeon]|nr:signal peptidase I [Candidatus Aenigmarchaeota archaeon]